MSKKAFIKKQLLDGVYLKEQITASNYIDKIILFAYKFAKCIKSGGKIMLCGNGGSASDCQHIASEFIGGLNKNNFTDPLPVISLVNNSSIITAISNDYGFEFVFSKQIRGLGKENDCLLCLSTSGNSNNLISACYFAKRKKIKTFALLGKDGGKLKKKVDYYIIVPSKDTQRIQEVHITIGHILVSLLEKQLFLD